MDEPSLSKRNASKGRKGGLRSYFWTARCPDNSEILDSYTSLSADISPLQSPPAGHPVQEPFFSRQCPVEPKGQEPFSRRHLPAGHPRLELFSPWPYHGTQPEQEPFIPQLCLADPPGQGPIPPHHHPADDVGLEPYSLLRCPAGHKGPASSSPQHFPADHPGLEVSSLGQCHAEPLGLESSSFPHHQVDRTGGKSDSPQLYPSNQPMQDPCPPRLCSLNQPVQKPSSPRQCHTIQPGQDTCCPQQYTTNQQVQEPLSPQPCLADQPGQELCPPFQLPANCHELESFSAHPCHVDLLKLESSSPGRESTSPRHCAAYQPGPESYSPWPPPTDRPQLESSSPLHCSTEQLRQEAFSPQQHTAVHSNLESCPPQQCSADRPRPEPSSPKHLPANRPTPASFSPRHLPADQTRPEPSYPRHHPSNWPRPDSSPIHHPTGQSWPELASPKHHTAEQLRPESSSPRHHPADRPKPESSSPKSRPVERPRPEPFSPRHLPADRPRPDSSSPRHLPADRPRPESSSSRHLPANWPRPEPSSPRHLPEDRPRPEISSPRHLSADRPRPDSSTRHHPADCSRPKSSSPRQLPAECPRLESFYLNHHPVEWPRPEPPSPTHHPADFSGPESSSPKHCPADRPKLESSPVHCKADLPRPGSSPNHRTAERPRPEPSPAHNKAQLPRTESHSPPPQCPSDCPGPESSSPRHHPAEHTMPKSSSPRQLPAECPRPESFYLNHHPVEWPRPKPSAPTHHPTDFPGPESPSPKHRPADRLKLESSPVHCKAVLPRPRSSPNYRTAERPRLEPSPLHHKAQLPRPESRSPPPQCPSDCPGPESSSPRHLPASLPRPESSSLPPQCPSDRFRPNSSSPQHLSADQFRTQSSSAHHQPAGGGPSVLLSKVKALKENRTLGKKTALPTPEQNAPKKPMPWQGKISQIPTVDGEPREDAVVKPEAQIRTYLTESLLTYTEETGDPEGLTSTMAHVTDGPAITLSELPSGNLWRCPEKHWGSHGSGCNESPKDVTVKGEQQRPSSGEHSIINSTKSGHISNADQAQISFPEANQLRGIHGRQGTPEDLTHTLNDDPLESSGLGGRLWRAESWDSIGSNTSSGSNNSMLTLAERVERNRVLLKEMLSLTEQNRAHQDTSRDHSPGREGHLATTDGNNPGPLTNDMDWYSGVSLPDSEGCRAFLPQQELALSARHEQAKQLLLRARMKARTSPLRASHHLLPTPAATVNAAQGTEAWDLSPDQTLKQSCPLPEGAAPPNSSLSDSSSGESSSSQRRRRHRGPSPSRVRFEDESARDAEVRYLERLQQRQRRVLDSVILSLGQGPLVSKPDLSDYISGEGLNRGDRISKTCRRQNCLQAMGHSGRGLGQGAPTKASPLTLNDRGKCNSCGSYINSSGTNSISGSGVTLTGNECFDENGAIQVSSRKEAGDPMSLHLEPAAPPSASRGSPLWILPSRQRIHTERIRETYIGEVTYIDDVDSALDSTDTSDSGRTDSEGANAVSTRPQGRLGSIGCPSNGCALVTTSAGTLEMGDHPSHVDGDNRGRKGLLSGGGEEIAISVDKGRSANLGESCLVETGFLGEKIMGSVSVVVDATDNVFSPLMATKKNSQEHQKFEERNFSSLCPGQEPAASLPKSTANCWGTQEQVENCTSQCHSEVRPSRSRTTSDQTQKAMIPHCNVRTRVPVPPSGKVNSPVPHRKATTAGSHRLGREKNGPPNHASRQAGSKSSPLIPQSLSQSISQGKKNPQPTLLSTSEAHTNCLHPTTNLPEEPGSLHHVSLPLSKREKNMQDPFMSERLNNLQCVSALELEGQKNQKLTSAPECEGLKNTQPNYIPVHEGPGDLNANCAPVHERSWNLQPNSTPILKGQRNLQSISGPVYWEKNNLQQVYIPANGEKMNLESTSGPEGQRHLSRNTRSTKLKKAQLGALSSNNCNNTRMELCQQGASLPGGARNSMGSHTSKEHQKREQYPTGGARSSMEDLTTMEQHQYEEYLPGGPTSSMGQDTDYQAGSMPGDLSGDGGLLPLAGGTLNCAGITLSLMSSCTEPGHSVEPTCPETPEEGPEQRKGAVEDKTLPPRTEDVDPGTVEQLSPLARKRSGSASGLRKFFSAIGQKTQQKLGRGRSSSLEHIATMVAAGEAAPVKPKAAATTEPGMETNEHGMKKTPSLQSLRLVSPFRQLRKAASAQNLHSGQGKTDRSSCYLLGSPESQGASDRKSGGQPRRTLSVEDIGAPDRARAVGRVTEVFPDGTCHLELRRPPNGSFGFCISSGNGRPDTGVYVQEMADASTAKLYAGLLAVGDEILEVNGAKVAGLSLATLSDLMARVDTLSIRLLQQRRPLR